MCLGIPMQVLKVSGGKALCHAKGIDRWISLIPMLDDFPAAGDWVLINSGRATRKVSAEEARQSWEIFDQLLADDGLPA